MRNITLAILSSLVLSASTANADLLYVELFGGPHQHPDGEHNTLRVIAVFNDPNDRLVAVSGSAVQSIYYLVIWGELYNQPQYEGFWLNDFPTVGIGGEPWDTYVTLGATSWPHNVSFTPGFLTDSKDPPVDSVIEGCNFEEDDGAWFYVGEAPTVEQFDSIPNNNTYDVVIAQLTLDSQAKNGLHGNIEWITASGEPRIDPFVAAHLAVPELADLNQDGWVNTEDLLLLFASWGTITRDPGEQVCPDPPDFNDDGIVDVIDLEFLLAHWGEY